MVARWGLVRGLQAAARPGVRATIRLRAEAGLKIAWGTTEEHRVKRFLAACTIAAMLLAGTAFAQPAAAGQTYRVEVRPGVQLPWFAVWRDDAVATVVLFSGGAGGMGRLAPGAAWPGSNNFLIRTAPLLAQHPFNIVIMGRASDTRDLDLATRTGATHLADNQAVLRAVRQHSGAPIWLVGTSRGTVSAAELAIHDDEHLVSGLVETSSILAPGATGSLTTLDLARIRVPTLVVHHEHDACRLCPPSGVDAVVSALANAPIKARRFVAGGEDQAQGNPCEALHNHGYRGIEPQVVELIADWIVQPRSP
jgi:predicted alpha/beta-hydrolase family hydrolase